MMEVYLLIVLKIFGRIDCTIRVFQSFSARIKHSHTLPKYKAAITILISNLSSYYFSVITHQCNKNTVWKCYTCCPIGSHVQFMCTRVPTNKAQDNIYLATWPASIYFTFALASKKSLLSPIIISTCDPMQNPGQTCIFYKPGQTCLTQAKYVTRKIQPASTLIYNCTWKSGCLKFSQKVFILTS